MFKFWSKIAGNSFSPLSTSFMILDTEKTQKHLLVIAVLIMPLLQFHYSFSDVSWKLLYHFCQIWAKTQWVTTTYSGFLHMTLFFSNSWDLMDWPDLFLGASILYSPENENLSPLVIFPFFFCFSKITCEVIIHFSKLILKLKLYKK